MSFSGPLRVVGVAWLGLRGGKAQIYSEVAEIFRIPRLAVEQGSQSALPNGPLLRALESLLDGIRGVLKVLGEEGFGTLNSISSNKGSGPFIGGSLTCTRGSHGL